MRHQLVQAKKNHLFELDSAGVQSHHIGEQPDSRTQAVALAKGIRMDDLKARQITFEDFAEFDLLLAMDKGHYQWLRAMAPASAVGKVKLYLEYAGISKPLEVPDPYYGETEDFEVVLEVIEQATGLLITRHC